MTETMTPRWELGKDTELHADNYAYPAGEPDLVPGQPWTGLHPVHVDLGYPYPVSEAGNDILLLCCFAVMAAGVEPEPFWLYQGHGGCGYHHDLPDAGVCNAQDGDGHPNLWANLPDGTRFEATWDELAAKPRRTTVSTPLTDDIASALLAVFWRQVPADVDVDRLLAASELGRLLRATPDAAARTAAARR